MRLAIRIAGILVVLVVVALVALAVALPRLVGSDAARARIEAAAKEATGREVRYGELDFGLLPPRLVVKEPRMGGASEDAPAVFEAAGVELEIALAPLLARAVVIDSLVVEGGTMRLLRTEKGIELPAGPTAEKASEKGKDAPAPPKPEDAEARKEKEPGGEEGFALALRQVSLRDCKVLLEDQTLSPPGIWEVGDVAARATGKSTKDPIDFEIDGALSSGGSIRVKGEAEIGGPFRIDYHLTDVVLAPLAPYLSKGRRLGGAVSGTVSILREEEKADRVTVDVSFRGGELAADDLAIRGEMKLQADLEGGLGKPNGTFQLDATDAELEYGAAFRKGRGTAATATGRIVTGADGEIGLEDTEVTIKNFEAEVQVETGARRRTTIEADPFDLTGWGTMIPALEQSAPTGTLAARGLVVTTKPLEVRGALDLQDVRLQQKSGAEIFLRGGFRGTGPRIRSEDLVALVAGQQVRLSVELNDLAATPHLVTKVEADDLESSDLVALFSEKKDTLQGPMELRGSLGSPLGAGKPLAETVNGRVSFRIEPGRLKGVSLLEKTFQRVGSVGDAALVAGEEKGGRTLQRFYDDEFQYLGGTLRIGGGLARTDDLQLVYHNYTVDLRGSVALADQRLDLRGKLTIDEEIDGAIASQGAAGQKAKPASSRVIPLARVTGTLDSPRVEVTDDAVFRFAALYATHERREEWEGKIDEYLGKGEGAKVLDALDGLLSGQPREKSQ